MGNCVGGGNVRENVFRVVNINDNKHLVQKGFMEVTAVELIYTDSKSNEDWHWPLKYLRKYGCDGDVFTFEAGRKCPGGEGLYAFSTKKASVLFEMVARNINQGNLQPAGDLSPFNEPHSDTETLSFPLRRQSATTSPNTADQPAYTNVDIMGNPLQNGDPAPSSDTPVVTVDPKRFEYREVIFDKHPDEHPRPAPNVQQTPSYTKIDFDKTEAFNKTGAIPGAAGAALAAPHGRTSSTSTSGSISPTKKTHRSRVHTYGGRDRQISESSFSSQSSLTESSRDIRGRPNGRVSDISNPTQKAAALEQQYQNVKVGGGEVGQVFEQSSASPQPPQQQPNYCNITPGPSTSSLGATTPESHHTPTSTIITEGESMSTYAQLELGKRKPERTMSSSAASRESGPHQLSYMQMEFQSGDGSSSVPQPNAGRRTVSLSSAETKHNVSSATAVHPRIPEEEVILPVQPTVPAATGGESMANASGVRDETKVTYGMLDFSYMKALSELSTQREQEIEQQKEQREKEQKEKEQKEKTGARSKLAWRQN